MRILFLFVDGIGLGDNDPETNPFVVAKMPTLTALTNGKRWVRETGKQISERAIFIPTDPRLGIAGRPQSGSSQAAILTGRNVPQLLGRHYGPLPDEQTRNLLTESNFFKSVREKGKRAALLVAYPEKRLKDIERGYKLPSSIQYAARAAGQAFFTLTDLIAGRALTAEYTGQTWRKYLKIKETPVYLPQEAGRKLVKIARNYDFAFHSHWMTDYVGHRGHFEQAVELLELLDGVIEGVLDAWDDEEGLVILSSDHGNMEHIGNRKHTENDVPTLIIGKSKEQFAQGFQRLTDFVPHMSRMLFPES